MRRWSIPGHDYKGARVSCIGQEKRQPRAWPDAAARSSSSSCPSLDLAPGLIGEALPANLRCGKPGAREIHGA